MSTWYVDRVMGDGFDVKSAAYTATHGPEAGSLAVGAATCACCGRGTDTSTPTNRVVSENFTGYDTWAFPRGRQLCPTCTWTYTTTSLRSDTMKITPDPQLHVVDRAAAYQALAAGELTTSTAWIIPIRRGRKHLLPLAQWGTITTDAATIAWSDNDAATLRMIAWLRTHGFGSRHLQQPAPPYPILAKAPHQHWNQILHSWDTLTDWSCGRDPWLQLAIHLTIPTGDTTR